MKERLSKSLFFVRFRPDSFPAQSSAKRWTAHHLSRIWVQILLAAVGSPRSGDPAIAHNHGLHRLMEWVRPRPQLLGVLGIRLLRCVVEGAMEGVGPRVLVVAASVRLVAEITDQWPEGG